MTIPTGNKPDRRVFHSVFGVAHISQPTPVASPATGFTAPGQAFGGPIGISYGSQQTLGSNIGVPSDASQLVRDQITWDRSWHTVTHALQLPDIRAFTSSAATGLSELVSSGTTFYNALEDVLDPETRLPWATRTESIIVWHTQQVRQHFFWQIVPAIIRWKIELSNEALLFRGIEVLKAAHRQYFQRLSIILERVKSSSPVPPSTLQTFRRDFHAIVSNSLSEPLLDALSAAIRRLLSKVLGISFEQGEQPFRVLPESSISGEASTEMLGLVQTLQNVGLAGENFQVIFAEIMNDAMSQYVKQGYKGVWSCGKSEDRASTQRDRSIVPRTAHRSAPSRCVTDLCEWVENRYAKIAIQVFNILENARMAHEEGYKELWFEKENYKEMSIGRLTELRINELFDIVLNWPNTTGALDDLRTAITSPQRRLNLTDVFSKALRKRLLHPGASTLQILRIYVPMIWSFHALDHSKVLLDRVAYPLQEYLCSREDTVRIIIAGLLADTKDAEGDAVKPGGDKLVELALLLDEGSEQSGRRGKDDHLDWHDLSWEPDPVDAGPGYKRSKDADIIGTLLGVLGSQEVFIKEFQSIIGENLLKNDGSFVKEVRVLELLKARFGEASLQSCEVMLKDIEDSNGVNKIIRRNQQLDPSTQEIAAAQENEEMSDGQPTDPEGLYKPSLHAKILSRLFWPQLHDEGHRVPDAISELQQRYEEGFESFKSARKLTWLNALGQATVELELADRTIVEEVHTWQASLIYSFQSAEDTHDTPTRSVLELVEELEMEESLVRSSLKFWVNKLVLQETEKDVFSVRETLNPEDLAKSTAPASSSEASRMEDRRDEAANGKGLDEKMQMYWQFTQGMLRNSSSQMPLQQIAMMLRMLVVDGFPYSNEELAEFLASKVAEGELELVGGKYKLKK